MANYIKALCADCTNALPCSCGGCPVIRPALGLPSTATSVNISWTWLYHGGGGSEVATLGPASSDFGYADECSARRIDSFPSPRLNFFARVARYTGDNTCVIVVGGGGEIQDAGDPFFGLTFYGFFSMITPVPTSLPCSTAVSGFLNDLASSSVVAVVTIS